MIGATDDDFPDREELEALEDDGGFLDDNEALAKIRTDMLKDPELTEREIAAFFEGFRLFQIKTNSLTAQLEGMKAMQRLRRHRSIVSSRQLGMHSAASERSVGQSRPFIVSRGSMPPIMSKPETAAELSTKAEPITKSRPPLSPANMSTAASRMSTATPLFSIDSEDDKAPGRESEEADQLSSAPPHREMKKDSGPRPISRSLRALSIKRIREDIKGDAANSDIQKLLEELVEAEQRQKKLEKQLAQAGVVIAEDIPYDVAKAKVESIATRMAEIGGSDVKDPKLREEYFKLEQDMEKYTAALMLTDEYAEEQEELERSWEESVTADNQEAIKKLRRHMPVEVRNMSESALCSQPSPNGQYLPKSIAKKFKRTNVLQILRIDPNDIVRMHPSTLENMRVTGLTLTERRALYEHLGGVGPRWKAMQADKMTERKWTWYNMMKSNFKENVESWQRHADQYGPPGNHPYATSENPGAGCPLLGKQCPLKSDKLIDYDGDYGFPEDAQYFQAEVKISEVDNISKARQEALEAVREKKATERSESLKQHYKSKILQVSLANGACEAMDESIDNMETTQDKWIRGHLKNDNPLADDSKKKEVTGFNDALNELKLAILLFAERSGMQLTGKRDANADKPDTRSVVELALCEEVFETAIDFFDGIDGRMMEIKVREGRMKSMINQLRELLEELHERNLKAIEILGVERPPRSRKMKTREEITAEIKKEPAREKRKDEPASDTLGHGSSGGMPDRGGGRGGLMDAIAGRGRGGRGGRGGLMDAIAGRGRGRSSGGDGGGRGNLLSAIAGRDGGGRGGLVAAIAARGGEGG